MLFCTIDYCCFAPLIIAVLQVLLLQGNVLTDLGSAALAAGIECSEHGLRLQRLDLAGNEISAVG